MVIAHVPSQMKSRNNFVQTEMQNNLSLLWVDGSLTVLATSLTKTSLVH